MTVIGSEHTIIVQGKAVNVEEYQIDPEETETLYPGSLVKINTNGTLSAGATADDDTTSILGWLGYEQAHAFYKPKTRNSPYKAGDMVPVIRIGSGSIIMAKVVEDENIVDGTPLIASTDEPGSLEIFDGDGNRIAQARGPVRADGLAPIMFI
jgi:hypothetical protein